MLILTRRPGETIRIGDDIEVTILEKRGHQIRVGVTSPRSLPVHRSELWERIERENAE